MGFILNKTVVRTFYRQLSGFFVFVFLVFFGLVQPSTQLYFHYALISGILQNFGFMALVGAAWLLYGFKVRQFVRSLLEDPDSIFLYRLNSLSSRRVLRLCLAVQAQLFAPVAGYAVIIAAVAVYQKATARGLAPLAYAGLLITFAALDMRRCLRYPGENTKSGKSRLRRRFVPYWSILGRFLLAENKGILLGVKVFGGAMLYLFLRIQTPADYDLRMPFLAYSLALFGHGVLFFRVRQLETTRLIFYRALPVPPVRRLAHHALLCFLLLAPETMILGWMIPHPIRLADGLLFVLMGYGILLLLDSLLIAGDLTAADYLKLCLVLFGILYGFVLKAWG
jgi:hypothetical protein